MTEREQYQKDWNEANERIGLTEDASDKTGSEKGAAAVGFVLRLTLKLLSPNLAGGDDRGIWYTKNGGRTRPSCAV